MVHKYDFSTCQRSTDSKCSYMTVNKEGFQEEHFDLVLANWY